MRSSLLLVVLLMLTNICALDYIFEIDISARYFSELPEPESNINGIIDINLIDNRNISSDLSYFVNDNEQYLNEAKVKLIFNNYDLIIGRQLIGWGNGFNYNPTDVFNKKPIGSSFDSTYRKKGRDIVKLSKYSDNYSLDFVYAFGQKFENDNVIIEKIGYDIGGRYKVHMNDFDFALSYVYRSNYQIFNTVLPNLKRNRYASFTGIDVAGTLPLYGIGFQAEISYEVIDNLSEYIIGWNRIIYESFDLKCEYYYNGFGKTGNYIFTAAELGYALAQNYLIPSMQYFYNEKWNITLYSFINLDDASFTIGNSTNFLFNDNIEFILSPFISIGDSSSEFGLQEKIFGIFGAVASVKIIY